MSVKTPQSTSMKRACKIDDYLLDANFYKAVVRWALRNMNVQKKKKIHPHFIMKPQKYIPKPIIKTNIRKRAFAKWSNKNEVQGWLALQTSAGASVSVNICPVKSKVSVELTFTFKWSQTAFLIFYWIHGITCLWWQSDGWCVLKMTPWKSKTKHLKSPIFGHHLLAILPEKKINT